MATADNWSKDFEKSESIKWSHNSSFGFSLFAEKIDGSWILKLSSSTLPDKYSKKIVETGTKKRAKSFAIDWRKSHTETKDLLKESGFSSNNARKFLNPFNISLGLITLFLFLALLQTWNFIEPVFGEVFIGIIMGAGGLIFVIEGFYNDREFDLKAPLKNAEETVSLLSGSFAILSSYGYITGSEFYLTHFSGVQGGILAYMVAYLIVHWMKNRVVGYSKLVTRYTRNRSRELMDGIVKTLK